MNTDNEADRDSDIRCQFWLNQFSATTVKGFLFLYKLSVLLKITQKCFFAVKPSKYKPSAPLCKENHNSTSMRENQRFLLRPKLRVTACMQTSPSSQKMHYYTVYAFRVRLAGHKCIHLTEWAIGNKSPRLKISPLGFRETSWPGVLKLLINSWAD